MATRPRIPQHIVDDLMFINRHTCCVCQIAGKHVQVHHINEDASNSSIENLAVLCLDCHSIVTGDEGLGRRYSPGEVHYYKTAWEAQCAPDESYEDNDEGEEGPVESHYEDSILEANTHLVSDYDLEEANEVCIWAASDEPIDVVIMKRKDYKRWLNTHKIASFEEFHENQLELETSYIAPNDGQYSVVVINNSNKDVEMQLDISVWSD